MIYVLASCSDRKWFHKRDRFRSPYGDKTFTGYLLYGKPQIGITGIPKSSIPPWLVYCYYFSLLNRWFTLNFVRICWSCETCWYLYNACWYVYLSTWTSLVSFGWWKSSNVIHSAILSSWRPLLIKSTGYLDDIIFPWSTCPLVTNHRTKSLRNLLHSAVGLTLLSLGSGRPHVAICFPKSRGFPRQFLTYGVLELVNAHTNAKVASLYRSALLSWRWKFVDWSATFHSFITNRDVHGNLFNWPIR